MKYRKAGEQESQQNKQKCQRFLRGKTVPHLFDFLEKDGVADRKIKLPLLRQKELGD